MNTQQHTPGPWVISKSVMGETAIVSNPETGSGTHVANLPLLTIYAAPADNYKANAKLIAAAPELLKACHILFDAYNAGITLSEDNYCKIKNLLQ